MVQPCFKKANDEDIARKLAVSDFFIVSDFVIRASLFSPVIQSATLEWDRPMLRAVRATSMQSMRRPRVISLRRRAAPDCTLKLDRAVTQSADRARMPRRFQSRGRRWPA